MAILKKTYLLILLAVTAMGLNSCYSEFDPHFESTPVLCMNSIITPGDTIKLFLTRTWSWTEEDQYKIDVNVRDAEVRLIVNGKFQETLTHTVFINPDYPFGPYPRIRECYQSTYLPKSGDVIRIEASSRQYGQATAEVIVPYPVPLERLEPQILNFNAYGDMSGFPAVEGWCRFELRFKLLAYFTDPSESTDYYDLMFGYHSSGEDYGEDAGAFVDSYTFIDVAGEPLLKEHVSILESITADTSGYTVFSDRQINGKTYPLRLGVDNLSFIYRNPLNLQGPKEFGIQVTLRHINQAYYKHVISVWEGNDALTGVLGGVGLSSPVYPWSNVSTGAGVVAAYAKSSMIIPIVDIIALAQQEKFK